MTHRALRNPHRVSTIVLLTLAAAASGGAVPVNQWLSANSGLWTDAARWSLGVTPGIPGAMDEDAVINAAGAPYTVTLLTTALLRDLSILSSDATLTIAAGGDLTVGRFGRIGDALDPLAGGTVLLNGGTLRGGEWSIGPGGQFRVRGNQGNRLVDSVVHGDVLLEAGGVLTVDNAVADRWRLTGNSSTLRFESDATIANTVSFEGLGSALRLIRSDSADTVFHFTSSAVVESSQDFAGRGLIGSLGYQNETIINDGRFTASAGSINLGASSITNNGMMQAHGGSIITSTDNFINTGSIDAQGSVFTVATANPDIAIGLTNSGSLTAADSSLNLSTGLQNTGSIHTERSTVFIDAQRFSSTGAFNLLDSVLRVGGEFVLGDLAPITRTNSTVSIAGTLANDGQTLDLSALSDRLALDGGSIRGGAVLAGHSTPLRVMSNSSNALEGVAFSGRLAFDDEESFLRLRNGASIEGVIDMTNGRPEIRFEGAGLFDNSLVLFVDPIQTYFASDLAGQTLRIGQNAILRGNNLVNAPRGENGGGAPFEMIENYGEWLIEGSDFWQLQSARSVINHGLISVGSSSELVVPAGFDSSSGEVQIAEGGILTVLSVNSLQTVSPSFFNGNFTNDGIIALSAIVDLEGESVTLREGFGDTRMGTGFFNSLTSSLRNGTIDIEEGASLTFDRGSIAVTDLVINGGVSVNQNANTTLSRVAADSLTIRGGSTSVVDSEIGSTRFERGTLVATDLSDLGTVSLFAGGPTPVIRLTAASGGIIENGNFEFEAGTVIESSSLRFEALLTPTLTNRIDWNLEDRARVILQGTRVINDADVTLSSNASLTIESQLAFLNPGSITLNGGGLSLNTPIAFDQILNDRNDLAAGTISIGRSTDLGGATIELGADAGAWRLNGRIALRNGVIDNADGQTFVVIGSSSPDTVLENIDFTGDVSTTGSVTFFQNVGFRALTFRGGTLSFELGAVVEGLLIQDPALSAEIVLYAPPGGPQIAEGGGIVAVGRSGGSAPRAIAISDGSGAPFIRNEGLLHARQDSEMRIPHAVLNQGLMVVDSGAELSTGNLLQHGDLRLASDASVVVRGDLDFESVSSTLFEVVGASASRGYAVFDTAHLGGSLEVIVTSDTAPSLGDRWSLVRATEITSEFGSVSLAALADPELRLFLRLTEGTLTDSLELLVRHIADPNGDMMVNMDDLNLVLHDYGQTGALLAGDADTNGIVDFRDLNLVLANFGQTFRAVAVPTPGGIALALLGVGLAGRRQR